MCDMPCDPPTFFWGIKMSVNTASEEQCTDSAHLRQPWVVRVSHVPQPLHPR